MHNTKKWILGFLLFDLLLLSWACSQTRQAATVPTPSTANPLEVGDEKGELFVLKEKDEANQALTVFHLGTSREMTLSYTGATSVKNRYGRETALDQLPPGEMVDVTYDPTTGSATMIKVSEEAWEYPGVSNPKYYGNENRMQIGERNYRVAVGLLVFSGNECIDWMSVGDVDELTVKGVGDRVHSIIVTKGHGYVRPTNYADFVGGIVSVGRDVIRPISEDMLIMVREGSYLVTMQNGNLTGAKNVVVTRNVETPLDMAEFKAEPKQVGDVTFEISPYGSDLYVNDKLTDYQNPVRLRYGKHKIRVSLTGYEDYNAILDVQTPSPTIVIDLADDDGGVDESETDDETDLTGTDAAQTTQNPVYDNAHTITVSEPEGVNVYFNGVFRGTAPCSFPKQIGTHSITLSKAGSTTKSYTVEIADDQENVEWRFPAIN